MEGKNHLKGIISKINYYKQYIYNEATKDFYGPMKDLRFSATARKQRGLKKTILTDTRASVTLVSTAGRRE